MLPHCIFASPIPAASTAFRYNINDCVAAATAI